MRSLHFQLCPYMKDGISLQTGLQFEPSVLLDVDVREVNHHFETLASHAIRTQGGWGINSWDRYESAIAFIENSASIHAPALRLNGVESGLVIIDGRHRLQALLDLGFTNIRIGVPQRQAAKIVIMLRNSSER